MTRLIDADALNEKLCKTTIFIKGGEIFQRMINDAPTVELDGDFISRQDAIEAICKTCCGYGGDYYSCYKYKDSDCQEVEVLHGLRPALPSAPDSRQRGEWVRNDKIGTFKIFTCDKCGCNMDTDAWDFCPNCGARMYKGGAE